MARTTGSADRRSIATDGSGRSALRLDLRVELERRRVDAVAQAGRARSVVEDVAEVAATAAHIASVRVINNDRSVSVATAPRSAGAKKLGQPVPDSNFVSDRNSSAPQPAQR